MSSLYSLAFKAIGIANGLEVFLALLQTVRPVSYGISAT